MHDTIINAALTAEIERLNDVIARLRSESARLMDLNAQSLSAMRSMLSMIAGE